MNLASRHESAGRVVDLSRSSQHIVSTCPTVPVPRECPVPRTTESLDATIDIVTPENIAFEYRVAGPFRRLPALVFDYVLRVSLYVALWFLFIMCVGLLTWLIPPLRSFLERLAVASVAGLIILWFAIDWFYGGVFETMWNGQTPGKRLFGIRVVTTSGQPINGLQAILRNVLRYVDLYPMLSIQMLGPLFAPQSEEPVPPAYLIPTMLFALGAMFMTSRFQRLGDLVCGTMVIVEERQWLTGVAKLEDPRAAQLAAYLPTDFQVSRTLARALAMYVDRRRLFTPARRKEVARHLAEPLIRMFGLPLDTSHDLLLCALYYRAFVADRGDAVRPANMPAPMPTMPPSPFAPQLAGAPWGR